MAPERSGYVSVVKLDGSRSSANIPSFFRTVIVALENLPAICRGAREIDGWQPGVRRAASSGLCGQGPWILPRAPREWLVSDFSGYGTPWGTPICTAYPAGAFTAFAEPPLFAGSVWGREESLGGSAGLGVQRARAQVGKKKRPHGTLHACGAPSRPSTPKVAYQEAQPSPVRSSKSNIVLHSDSC